MATKISKAKPPYPTIGEIIRLLAGAFDTKLADPDLANQLDRLAREGDFDWSLRTQLVKDLIQEPLQKIDPEFSDFTGEAIYFWLEEYIKILSKISLDALSREEAIPLLIETLGSGYVARFMIELRDRYGGPDLGDFLRQNANPVDVVFEWGKTSLGLDAAAIVFPDNKQKRDDVGRWRRGKTIPKVVGTISLLLQDLKKSPDAAKPKVSLFGKWLIVARVLMWLEIGAGKAGLGSLIPMVGQHILLDCPPCDVCKALSIANIKAAEPLREVSRCGLELLHISLSRQRFEKKQGSQETARQEINRFKDLLNQHDPDGRARYILDWCEGRWHVLAGKEKQALKYYEKAADQALHRAGANQGMILEEALSLAAFLGKKPAIKRIKHRAVNLGLFSSHFARLPETTGVVADWEVDQWAQTFNVLFPQRARFKEAPRRPSSGNPFPFRFYDLAAAEKIKPDLKAPNRVISLPTLDGTKYRRPQLIWFASEDRVEDVQRLLDAGADVNIKDEQGGSALLCAIQCAEDGRGRQALDLLLEWPHQKATLDRLTQRKRLSPLYMAVLLGDPNVVARLLEMGASPDLKASYPPQTPLYVCVEQFAYYREGWAEGYFRQRMMNPGPEDAEVHRRYSGGLAGVTGDQLPVQFIRDPRYSEIFQYVIKDKVEKKIRTPRVSYIQIVELLLQYGADPNLKHSSPGPGRTPLMVAAESDTADVFCKLIDAGGDPDLKDDEGNDCRAIARGFGSRDVLKYLSQ